MPYVEWNTGAGDASTQVRRLVRAVFGLHSTFKDEVWLWRGEADAQHPLEPGMHTRLRSSLNVPHTEASVVEASERLLGRAKAAALDRVDDVALPDLALLANLQHHGAATPLLDVTVDPLVALWMVANAAGDNVNGEDDRDGRLIAIRRPPPRRWLDAFDARAYVGAGSVSDGFTTEGVYWFRPPEISERLRIQRGSFLVGAYNDAGSDLTSLHLQVEPAPQDENWLADRIAQIGAQGRPRTAATDVAVFRVRASLKERVREWLEDRAGLSREVIYPTPWHRPHLEVFARTYGRRRALDDD